MSTHDWTPAIGLRNAAIALVWRAAIAAALWFGLLWVFHVTLASLGVTRVPLLIVVAFAAVAGTIAGLVLSRGLEETAGFVSPLLTLLALAFTALAIVGTESIFHQLVSGSTDHLRTMIVGATMIFAAAWVTKHTLLDL